MFSSTLIPVSFRESPGTILNMLVFLRYLGCERALFLHVVSGLQQERSRRRLEDLCDRLREGAAGTKAEEIELDIRVASGSPAMEIARAARDTGTDFVGMPWKRKNWLQRTLIGSTTKDVVRLSECPLLVYKGTGLGSSASADHPGPPVVMYATALQDSDEKIVPLLTWAGFVPERLILVHVGPRAPDPDAEYRRREAVNGALNELADRCSTSGGTVETVNLTGSPGRVIPRAARRERADLLVIGKAERLDKLTGVLGSTAEMIAYNASQSVLIVGDGEVSS